MMADDIVQGAMAHMQLAQRTHTQGPQVMLEIPLPPTMQRQLAGSSCTQQLADMLSHKDKDSTKRHAHGR